MLVRNDRRSWARFSPSARLMAKVFEEGHDRQRHSHLESGDPLGRAAAAQVPTPARRADPVPRRAPIAPAPSGSPTPPPRAPRWKPWPGSGRPRPTRPGSRSTPSTRALSAPRCGPRRCRARTPTPCRTPPRSRPSWCRCADLTGTRLRCQAVSGVGRGTASSDVRASPAIMLAGPPAQPFLYGFPSRQKSALGFPPRDNGRSIAGSLWIGRMVEETRSWAGLCGDRKT